MENEEILRAFFAGLALQGLLAGNVCNTRVAASEAVNLADDLLDELYGEEPDEGIAAIKKRRR